MANESKYDVFSNLGSIAPKSLFTSSLVPQYDENGTIVGYGQQQTFAVLGAMPVGVDENNPTPQGYQVSVGNIGSEPILANYDVNGNLTGYESRQFGVDGKNYAGNWDASGVAAPSEIKPHQGSFVSDFLSNDLGKVALIAAAYYGGPLAVEALSSGAAATVPEAISMGTGFVAPEVAGSAASAVGGTGSGLAAAAPAFTAALPAGAGYVAPEVTTLGNVAGTTEGMASGTATDLGSKVGLQAAPGEGLNLASTTGAPGLQTGTLGTSIADMGGAQGLTTAGAAGGVLGASGINAANAATMAGLGAAGLTGANAIGSTLGGINTGAAAAGLGAAAGAAGAGSTLADILPYTAGAGVVSGLLGANAATTAAQIQADAAAKAQVQQQANFETINKQQAPYRAAGYTALNDIAGLTSGQTPQYDANGNLVKDAAGNPVMTTGSGYLQHQFNAQDLAAGLAPNYDFMLQQGQMANQRAGNVGGGALSGNTLQGLQKYTQDYAGNAYQNAFTNYQTQRSNIYNTLAGIAGIGQVGQNATNTAATNATNAATQLGVGSAAATAAGGTGAANAYTNAINNATNNYTLAALLNQRGNVTSPTA